MVEHCSWRVEDVGSSPALGANLKKTIMKDNKEAMKENSFEDAVLAVCIVGIIAILIIAAVANRVGML